MFRYRNLNVKQSFVCSSLTYDTQLSSHLIFACSNDTFSQNTLKRIFIWFHLSASQTLKVKKDYKYENKSMSSNAMGNVYILYLTTSPCIEDHEGV